MLDLGFLEVLLIIVVALVVLGPKELSRAAFMLGNFVRMARSTFGDARAAFEDMAEQLESDSQPSDDKNNIEGSEQNKNSLKDNE